MRKVSPVLAACALTITCFTMAGSSVSGRALGLMSASLEAVEITAPATAVAVDDQQLPAPGITPAAAPKAAAEAAATIRTDKFDYQPGETALITGTGFAPGENVTLQVAHANGLVDGDGHAPFTVLADGSGNIDSQWFVNPDDSSGATFILTAVGETSGRKALTIFTDAVTRIVDDAGADDFPGQKDLNFFTFDFSGGSTVLITWGWDDTAWSGNNTGDACSLIDTDADGKANFAYCVTVQNTPAQFVAGRLYSCGDKKTDRCAQPVALLPLPNTPPLASTATAAVVAGSDPFGNHETPDHFDPDHLVGNTCGATPGCYTADTVAMVTLSLADTGSTSAKVLNVCSYPSQEPNSDPSECVIAPNSGFLTIVKSVTTTTDLFEFNMTDGAANDGTTHWQVNGAGKAADNVPIAPGTIFDLTETFGTAWQNSGGTCFIQTVPNPTSTGSFAAPKISNFTIQAGLETICTFTNTIRNGTLLVKKHVVNDNGGTKTAADFNLHVKFAGNDVTDSPAVGSESGTQYSLAPGTYVVSEDTPPSGYTNDGITGDCAANGSITITAGGSATCTITNNDQAATLKVIKHVINDNGGSKVAGDFTINVTATDASPSQFTGVESPGTTVTLDAGTYNVDEASDLGYTKTRSTDCSGTIANGQEKTCTITNDDAPNAVGLTTQQKVILHDRATISGILRGATETASTVTFRIYGTNTCATELGNEVVNVNLAAGQTSIQVGTTTGFTITLDTNPGGPSTTNRWWRAFYSGNNVSSGGGVLNSPQETLCTEATTVTMSQ
jgi:hypothetical protein